MFFSVYTLGCKLNQLETEGITDSFRRAGFSFLSDFPRRDSAGFSAPCSGNAPALIVVNTCTVTSMAEQKARRVIRKFLREYPEVCLIVTGCYAQLEREALAALEDEPRGRLFVIPGEKKDSILDLPAFLAGAAPQEKPPLSCLIASWFAGSFPGLAPSAAVPGYTTAGCKESGAFRFRPRDFSSHSRSFLKIQDGCDMRCAYCRVSLARGKSVSLGAEEVLAELRALERRAFTEAVLTGVNITQYRDSGMGLSELLAFLLEGTRKIRIRLSSVEPDGFSEDLFRVIGSPRIRPHFHLSVQSGCAEILAKMGRRYGPEDIETIAGRLRSVRDDPFLACDIIAGFPGETRERFEETFALCEKIRFAWIHAFPYSRRPGTAAYYFPEQISARDAAERAARLSGLALEGRKDYISRWEGKKVEAVVEAGKILTEGFLPGISENYLKLLVDCRPLPGAAPEPGFPAGKKPLPGECIRCRILGKSADDSRFDAAAEIC